MMATTQAPIPADQLTIVPANQAPWDDLTTIFGTTGALPKPVGACRGLVSLESVGGANSERVT